MAAPLKTTILGKPIPKERPRAGAGGHFYSPTAAVEGELAKQLVSYRGRFPKDVRVALVMRFYGANPQADLDNLAKLYMDVLVKAGVIADDKYVDALYLERKPDDGTPRTEIVVAEW